MIKNFFSRIKEAYQEGRYKEFFILVIPSILLVAIVLCGLVLFVNFIIRNFESLMYVATAVIVAAGFFYSGKPKEKPIPPKESGANNILFFEKILKRGLYVIFKDHASEFHVIPPTSFADLRDDLPSTYEPSKGCNIYRFKIMSDGTELEKELFHELLTSRLEAKLADGSLPLGRATVELTGRLYPRVCVDEVVFVAGAWHIAIIIIDSQNAANYIDSRQSFIAESRNSRSLEALDDDF